MSFLIRHIYELLIHFARWMYRAVSKTLGDRSSNFIGSFGSASTISLFVNVFGFIYMRLAFSPCIQSHLFSINLYIFDSCAPLTATSRTMHPVYEIMLVHDGRMLRWLYMRLASSLYVSYWQYYPHLALADAHEPYATRLEDIKSVEMDCIDRQLYTLHWLLWPVTWFA